MDTTTMQLKQLLNDDDAVSPVIGVILMVAITVILAAVIGTFVLGLGDQVQDTAPNTNMDFEYNGDDLLEITQTGGQGIDHTNLGVSIDGTIYHHLDSNEFDDVSIHDSDSSADLTGAGWFSTGTTSAGDSVTLDDGSSGSVSGDNIDIATHDGDVTTFDDVDEVRVVWRNGDQSSTVQTWENN